jgi:hypothetical protein
VGAVTIDQISNARRLIRVTCWGRLGSLSTVELLIQIAGFVKRQIIFSMHEATDIN